MFWKTSDRGLSWALIATSLSLLATAGPIKEPPTRIDIGLRL